MTEQISKLEFIARVNELRKNDPAAFRRFEEAMSAYQKGGLQTMAEKVAVFRSLGLLDQPNDGKPEMPKRSPKAKAKVKAGRKASQGHRKASKNRRKR